MPRLSVGRLDRARAAASTLPRPGPVATASGLTTVQPEPRRQPGHVVDGLDEVRRARARRSRRGSRTSPRSAGGSAGTAGSPGRRRSMRSPRASATGGPGRSRSPPAVSPFRRPTPSRASRARPSPLQVEPSTTSRSDAVEQVDRRRDENGGSPGHQTVAGRSWMISGVTIAERCRPASPPAIRWMVSAQVSGASSRGRMQCASTRASIHDGPSGSADWTTIVRDGCSPGQRLDRGRAPFRDLRPARDDDEVHHARPRRDVAAGLALASGSSGPAWPRSSPAPSRCRGCCAPAPTSAGPAR